MMAEPILQLYLGDCLDVMLGMESASVDLIFADPPFNAGKDYGDGFDDDKPLAEYREWLRVRLAEMVRLLKPGGTFWLMQAQRHLGFCQMALEQLGLDFRNVIVWAYANPTPAKRMFPRTWRPILFYSKGEPSSFDWRLDVMTNETLYYNPHRASRTPFAHDLWSDIPKLVGGYLSPKELIVDADGRFVNVAQMPERIAERILRIAAPSPCVAFDPFMGTGTFGAVATRLGIGFIGCECSPRYFEVARQRIESQPSYLPGMGRENL